MSDEFDNLDRLGYGIARFSGRPAAAVTILLAAAVIVSWLLLLIMAGGAAQVLPPREAGPGMSALEGFGWPGLVEAGRLFAQLCLSPGIPDLSGPARFAALAAMWFLMAVATMLPSAAPMIRTYCEIADTARGRGRRAVHPLVFVAGYLGVWLAAAGAFAGLSVAIQTGLAAGSRPLDGIAGAVVLAIAGLWQFTPMKDACLRKCRAPFATLFGRWTDRPAGVLRLGAEQGLWCLGCCWALMLVMFVVGLMNIFWMALAGVFAIVEKQGRGKTASRVAGAILLVWATALLVVSL